MDYVNTGAATANCAQLNRPDNLVAAHIAMTPDGRLRRRAASAFIGVAERTLANWQTRGLGPKSHLIGSRRFYYLADLQAFVAGVTAR